jgi:NADH-quinone oxidoreductase subunit K
MNFLLGFFSFFCDFNFFVFFWEFSGFSFLIFLVEFLFPLFLDMFLEEVLFFIIFLSLLIGVFGFITWDFNLIKLIFSMEIIFISLSLGFILESYFQNTMDGLLFAFYIIIVSAAESAIGFALLMSIYRLRKTTAIKYLNALKT